MRLFIRTEASNAVGLGHFMRCFAIAEEARAQGIAVTFLLNALSDPVQMRLNAIGAQGQAIDGPLGFVADIMALGALSTDRHDWLLIDSYQASQDYIRTLTNSAKVGVIDDLALLERYDCDLIVNPAQAASPSFYRHKTKARLCLGADFALIRREFRHAAAKTGAARGLAVMFGGSDPNQLTAGCARMLNDALPGVPLSIIAGPAHIHTEALKSLVSERPDMRLFIDPPSVAAVLAEADLVVTAAGGSLGEIAALGRAALALVVYDNQKAALESCLFPVIDARKGLPDDLGIQAKALFDDETRLNNLSANAHSIVDGRGPQRIVEAMFGV